MKLLLVLAAAAASARAYWLMGIEDFITTERLDPVVSPGKVSSHVHSVLGGSNFRISTNTSFLRQSECSSIPIPQDKSAYWFPHLYFQWNNGSFTSLNGGAVIYYLFSDTPGTTTAFPDDFRMLSGDPTLRTYNASSFAQQAVTFLCLDFNGVSTKYNSLPPVSCPSGIRAQINFPSCWDGKNLDSPDHKSHVAFLSNGPDSGSCSDPNFPVVLPRIFMELYWSSPDFESVRSQARNATQPFVFSYGDPTGYGYHADFINGWDKGVLQKAVDNCHCNPYGDATCCVNQGIFDMNQGKSCRITKAIDEQTTGTLLKLPGNNPVQPEGKRATVFSSDSTPALLSPIIAYTGNTPPAAGTIAVAAQTNAATSAAVTSVVAVTSAVIQSASASSPPATTAAASAVTSPGATATASASVLSIKSSAASSVKASATTPVIASTVTHAGIPTFTHPMPAPSHSHIGGVPAGSLTAPASAATPSAATLVAGSVSPSTPSAVAAPAGSASTPANAGTSSNANSGTLSSSSSGSKTCSSSKKKRAMEQHRRGVFQQRPRGVFQQRPRGVFQQRARDASQQLPHVRHLDYIYDTTT